MPSSPWRRPYVLIFTAILLLYTGTLYFQAATASLHEGYQPGIDRLKPVLEPVWLLLGLAVYTWLKRSAPAFKRIYMTSAGAFLVCLGMLGVIIAIDNWKAKNTGNTWFSHQTPAWVCGHTNHRENTVIRPEERLLICTVYTALFRPSFSNRSYSAVLGSSCVALLFCIWAAVMRKHHLRPAPLGSKVFVQSGIASLVTAPPKIDRAATCRSPNNNTRSPP